MVMREMVYPAFIPVKCGQWGIRTLDLLGVNEALYQATLLETGISTYPGSK